MDARIDRLRDRLDRGDSDMTTDEIQTAIDQADAKRRAVRIFFRKFDHFDAQLAPRAMRAAVHTCERERLSPDKLHLGYWSSPKMANVLVVPMNTRPPPTVGAMNLLPGPNWSRPPVAWLLL